MARAGNKAERRQNRKGRLQAMMAGVQEGGAQRAASRGRRVASSNRTLCGYARSIEAVFVRHVPVEGTAGAFGGERRENKPPESGTL